MSAVARPAQRAGLRHVRAGVFSVHLTKRARDLAQIDAELVEAAKAQERAIRAGDRPLFDAMAGLIDGLLDERHALLPSPRPACDG